MTLIQLRDVWAHIEKRCKPEGWMGVDGNLLQAHTATLYEVLRYVIKPASEPKKVSYVEFLGAGPQLPLWCVSHFTGMPFKDLLESHGETVNQCNLNDVAYLRAEVEDGPQWIHRVLREVHGLSPDSTVSVIEEHVAR